MKRDSLIYLENGQPYYWSSGPIRDHIHFLLPSWIEEKSAGRWNTEQVISISLEDIRTGGKDAVYHRLIQAQDGQPIVVNAYMMKIWK